jgi:hypothetical protein
VDFVVAYRDFFAFNLREELDADHVCQGLQFCAVNKTVPRGVHLAFAGDASRMTVSWLTYGTDCISLPPLLVACHASYKPSLTHVCPVLCTIASHSADGHVHRGVVIDARRLARRLRERRADNLPRDVRFPLALIATRLLIAINVCACVLCAGLATITTWCSPA